MNSTENLIADVVYEVTKKEVKDCDEHLMSNRLSIPVEDFLYIVDKLEKKTGISIAAFFEEYDYSILTIRNLAKIMDNHIKHRGEV